MIAQSATLTRCMLDLCLTVKCKGKRYCSAIVRSGSEEDVLYESTAAVRFSELQICLLSFGVASIADTSSSSLWRLFDATLKVGCAG